nr:MAG TPA: hypothetical protein [Caudoviricetes sp.]
MRPTDRRKQSTSLNLKKSLKLSALKAYSLYQSSLPPSRNFPW